MMFIDTSYGYHSSRPLRYVANCFTSLHRRLLIKSFTCRQNMNQSIISLRKQTNILQCYHCFPHLMHLKNDSKNAIPMVCHYPDLGCASDLVEVNFSSCMTNQKHYPDLGSDMSSAWNIWTRPSDIILPGNQCCCFLRLAHYVLLWEGCTDKLIHWDCGRSGPNSIISKEVSEQSWTI